MLCSKCNYDNPAAALFCMKCGTKVESRCSSCNTVNPADANFCLKCGGALGAAATASSRGPAAAAKTPRVEVTHERQTAEALDGERKTVTALFADIKGSTELMENLDPEDARAIIDPALKLMIDAVKRYDGYVVQSTGDGIFALFGAPAAYEDHPQRALYAALRMQEDLKRYSAKVVTEGSTPIQSRIGVNTGEVVVRSIQTGAGQIEYTPIGHTTNLASRMQTAAPVGSIAVSEATRKLCEGYFILESLGATKVKGVSEPVNVYEVTGLGPLRTRLQHSAGRGLTKFVGRQRELDAMKAAAERARAGHGQVVAAMADPGIGKSRLFFEFKATSRSEWMVLEAFSVSHGKASAYLPVVELLHGYFRILAEDDTRTRREKINGKVITLDRTIEDALPYLFGLLGLVEDGDDPFAQMDAQIKKRRTLNAIKRIVLRESLNQPLVLIFEDLHWIDEETQALLNLLVESIGNAKVLLLVNYRPEYTHHWNSKTYYTQLNLDPLGRESAAEMLSALLGNGKDLIPLKRLIIERTEGTPFFMEEMVQALFEDGVLLHNGEVKLVRSMNAVKVPATVQAILASRIDNLPAAEKELLQALAIIGKEFSLSIVQRTVRTSGDELGRMLGNLQLREFIYEQPVLADVEYTFKHALTQEVAYNSVLSERRKLIHERAAQAIESLFAASLADHYTDLAHHYGRSHSTPKAINYLQLAAQQAMNRSAYVEAGGQLATALDLLRTQPDDRTRDRIELAARLNLVYCVNLSVPGAFAADATLKNLERVRDLSEKIGDDASRVVSLAALVFLYNNRFEREKARALTKELLSVATRLNDPEKIGFAWCWFGFSSLWEGDLSAALDYFDQACRLPTGGSPVREISFGNWRTLSRSFASLTLWLLGYPTRAIARSEESLVISREVVGFPSDLIATRYWSVLLNLLLRDPSLANRHSAEIIQLASERSLVALLTIHNLTRGWVLVQIGQIEEGLAETRRAHTELGHITGTVPAALYPLIVAEVELAARRWPAGLEAVAEGIKVARDTGVRFSEAELLRLKGKLILMRNSGTEAEAAECFREAIEVARRQRAKSWELRASVSLARLLASQGRRDEARTMLADIYNWFTEGFDTTDLKDARALLDRLDEES